MDTKIVLSSIARHTLGALGIWLVKKGIIPDTAVTEFVTDGMFLGAIAWSIYQKYGVVFVSRLLAKDAATSPAAAAAIAAKVVGALLLVLLVWPAGGWAAPLSQTLPGPKSGPFHQGLEAIEQGPTPIGQAAKNGTLADYLADDVINKISADLEYADALAHQNSNVVTAPCLDAILALIHGWQAKVYPYVPVPAGTAAPVTPPDPKTALTMPDPHAIVTMERASELISQLQPNSVLSIGCAATINGTKKDIATLVGTVLSGGALGLFQLPVIPIP